MVVGFAVSFLLVVVIPVMKGWCWMKLRLLSLNDRPVGLFRVCESLLGLVVGECFSPRIEPLLFVFSSKSRWQLHSFACVGGIDAVFCDEKGVIVELVENWLPNGRYRAENAFKYLLEMPIGWVGVHKFGVGYIVSGIL